MKQDSPPNYRTKAPQDGGQSTSLLEMISARLVWTSGPHCWCKTFGQWAQVHQETHDRGELHTAEERCRCQSPGKQLHMAPSTPEPGSWDASSLYWNLAQRWKEWIHRERWQQAVLLSQRALGQRVKIRPWPAHLSDGGHNHTYTIEPFWGQTNTGWVRISKPRWALNNHFSFLQTKLSPFHLLDSGIL